MLGYGHVISDGYGGKIHYMVHKICREISSPEKVEKGIKILSTSVLSILQLTKSATTQGKNISTCSQTLTANYEFLLKRRIKNYYQQVQYVV